MVQGPGRPSTPNPSPSNAAQPNTGQANPGQPSIFGNGGPSFAQMPSFTPVTRGGQPGAAPAQPAAPQPAPAAFSPQPQAFPDPAVHQPPQPQAFAGGQPLPPQAQPYTAPDAAPTPPQSGTPGGGLPDFGSVDPGFPESIFGDVKLGTGFEDTAASQMEPPAPDASFTEPGFPEAGFPEEEAAFGDHPTQGLETQGLETQGLAAHDLAAHAPAAQAAAHQAAPTAYDAAGNPAQAYHPDAFGAQPDPYAAHPHAQHAVPGAGDPAMYAQPGQQAAAYGQVPPVDPSRQLQPVDPAYGQAPQIPLGDPRAGMHGAEQDFLDAGGDADFVDASVAAGQRGFKSKVMGTLKGRSAVMVASALLGAIALGGALAYAYKQSGGGIESGDAPIVTADASPVKAAPDAPGGKEFPHKNKLIYDRLTNNATPEAERLVPRQEDVAVPALPPATATAGLPAAVATSGPAAAEEGGPRRVRTMVVNPDGSVQAPAAMASDMANQAAAGVPGQPNMMPVPAIQPPGAAPQQVAAAAAPAAAAPAAASSYVVQLGSSKSQTDALANFADAQQKYPSLLGSYQPLVRKTDLGPRGTWYRLQVGPMANKDAAYRLCGQLKSQGHGDCLVMAQQ